MNEWMADWSEKEKQSYLVALNYVLTLDSKNTPTKREFMRKKAREFGCLISKLPKTQTSADLVKRLQKISSIRTKRSVLRDMILLSTADHDLTNDAITEIYEIGIKIGISPEKIDDFFLWAAQGLEWQVDGTRLIDEDI